MHRFGWISADCNPVKCWVQYPPGVVDRFSSSRLRLALQPQARQRNARGRPGRGTLRHLRRQHDPTIRPAARAGADAVSPTLVESVSAWNQDGSVSPFAAPESVKGCYSVNSDTFGVYAASGGHPTGIDQCRVLCTHIPLR